MKPRLPGLCARSPARAGRRRAAGAVVGGSAVDRACARAALLAAAFVRALLVTRPATRGTRRSTSRSIASTSRRPMPSGPSTVARRCCSARVCASSALASAASCPWFLACVAVGSGARGSTARRPCVLKRHLVGALLTIAIPRGLLVPVAGWSVIAVPPTLGSLGPGRVVAVLFVLGAAATKDFADVAGDRGARLSHVAGRVRCAPCGARSCAVPRLARSCSTPCFGTPRLAARADWRSWALWRACSMRVAESRRRGARCCGDVEGLAHAEQGHPAWRRRCTCCCSGTQVGRRSSTRF